jgi:UDP-N-acetylglucosamine acyltransferase
MLQESLQESLHQPLNNIHPKAKIGKNVTISPFVTIEADVVIGDDAWIGPCAAIMNGARLGKGCKVFHGAIVGAAPQDLKFDGEPSTVEIGNNVTIREYCTINRGTKASHRTIIKDNALIMAYVHIAHDCIVGKNCILANNVTLAGHITVGDWAVLGGMVAVHQFVRIGEHAMIGGGSLVRKDVPPFVKAAREPLSYVGINSTGMRRRGFTKEQLSAIQDIYRILFVKGYNVTQAKAQIQLLPDSTEKNTILTFINEAERGIMKGFMKKVKED